MTLGYLYHFHREHFRRMATNWSLPIAAIFLLPMFLLEERGLETWGFASLMIGFGLLLAWSVERRAPQILKPLAWIGVSSYSIYLWQQPVAKLFEESGAHSLFLFSCYVVIAITIGTVMARLIEIPALALRERFFSNRLSAPQRRQWMPATPGDPLP